MRMMHFRVSSSINVNVKKGRPSDHQYSLCLGKFSFLMIGLQITKKQINLFLKCTF